MKMTILIMISVILWPCWAAAEPSGISREARIAAFLQEHPDFTREDIEKMQYLKDRYPELGKRQLMEAVKNPEAFKERMKKKESLTSEQKSRLREFQGRWENMTPKEREELKKKFEDYKQMPPEQKIRVKENFNKFKNLSPEKRARLKKNYQEFKDLSPQDRVYVREKWKKLQSADSQERLKYKKEFREKRKMQRQQGFHKNTMDQKSGGYPGRKKIQRKNKQR